MNKKILTMAVAAAMIAPGAAMAEAILYGKLNVSLDYANVSNVVLPTYGILDDGTYGKLENGEDFEGWGMSNGYIPGERRANRIGVKGSEDLGNGLKAIYQVEFGINLNDTNNNVLSNTDTVSYRNTFVGLAGDAWGTALVGRHDTPMKISTGKLDLFADTMADYNGTVGFRDLRADNVLAYISPSWSGFQFAGAIVPAGGATGGVNPSTSVLPVYGDAFVPVYDDEGNVIDITISPVVADIRTATDSGLNLEEDSLAGAYSLAAIYNNGPFYASVAYESLGNQHFNTQDISLNFNNCPYEVPAAADRQANDPFASACAYTDDDATAWRIGLGLLDWNGFTLTGVWETRDHEPGSNRFASVTFPNSPDLNLYLPGNSDSVDLWQIQAAYAFGNSMVKAMYGQADYDSDFSAGSAYVDATPVLVQNLKDNYNRDVETWAIGFDHNLSKRTKAYALYTAVDNDAKNVRAGSEWDGFSIGMMHSF